MLAAEGISDLTRAGQPSLRVHHGITLHRGLIRFVHRDSYDPVKLAVTFKIFLAPFAPLSNILPCSLVSDDRVEKRETGFF